MCKLCGFKPKKRVYHVNQKFTECLEFHHIFGWKPVKLMIADDWYPESYDYIEIRYDKNTTKTKNGIILG